MLFITSCARYKCLLSSECGSQRTVHMYHLYIPTQTRNVIVIYKRESRFKTGICIGYELYIHNGIVEKLYFYPALYYTIFLFFFIFSLAFRFCHV